MPLYLATFANGDEVLLDAADSSRARELAELHANDSNPLTGISDHEGCSVFANPDPR